MKSDTKLMRSVFLFLFLLDIPSFPLQGHAFGTRRSRCDLNLPTCHLIHLCFPVTLPRHRQTEITFTWRIAI